MPSSAARWLAAILLAGALFRYFPIWFGLPYLHARPDEEVAVFHALKMLDGDLNPHFFHWPSLTFYLFAAVFAVVSAIRKVLLDDPILTRDVAVLTGRLIVAAAGAVPPFASSLRFQDPVPPSSSGRAPVIPIGDPEAVRPREPRTRAPRTIISRCASAS